MTLTLACGLKKRERHCCRSVVRGARGSQTGTLHRSTCFQTSSRRVALLASGAAVDLARQDGATPTFKACQKGHEAVAELLLRAGPRLDLLEVRTT